MNKTWSKEKMLSFLLTNNIYIIVALLFLIPAFTISNFASAGSITVLIKNVSLWGLMAIGVMFVLILGLTDLSLGMNVSMLTVFLAILSAKYGFWTGVLLTFIAGASAGMLNGFIIAKLKINAFITTFGTMTIFKGIGLIAGNGSPVSNTNETLANLFEVKILELPFITITLPMVIMILSLIGVTLFMKYTKLGQDIYITGGNIEAAKVSGINTEFVYIFCYGMVGVFAAITAVLLTSFQSSGNAAFGETYALLSITACVLGGIRMSGGFGTAIRAILGVTALQIINKILYSVAGQYANMQIGIVGMVLIAVLILDKASTRMSIKSGRVSR